jgi:hypothetical protein
LGQLDGHLDRPQLDQVEDVSLLGGGSGKSAGKLERLVGPSELCEQPGAVRLRMGRELDEPSLLTEGDSVLEGGERVRRP